MDSRFRILDGCDGSLVNLVKLDNIVNMVKLVKWLSSNLDPRLRHSRTILIGLFGVYLMIRKRAVLRYIYRLLAVYVSLLANIGVLYHFYC